MTDHEEIQQQISRYSLGCSVQDWDAVIGTFLTDGVWAVPSRGLEISGHAALRAAIAGFVAGFDHFVQINNPAIIAVTGDTATATSLIRECGKWIGREEALEVMGTYQDDLVRSAEGWKFARRTFTGIGLQGLVLTPPSLPG